MQKLTTLLTSVAAIAMVAIVPTTTLAQDNGSAAETTGEVGSTETPVLEPAGRELINSLEGSEPIYEMTPENARQVLLDAQSDPGEMLPASVERVMVPVEGVEANGGEVEAVVVRPDYLGDEPSPVVVYFHGGGWVLGNYETHQRLVRDLAHRTGATFVFVNYTPAPEAQHPVQLQQNVAVVRYVHDNPDQFNIDPERFALAGDSVGGQMSAVVPMMLAEEGVEIDLAAAVLFYPVTSAAMDTESYEAFSDGPWLAAEGMEWFFDQYLPEDADRSDWMVSPLEASDEQLTALPPTVVITDENDVLRDEGEAFAERLQLAGVDVESSRYNLIFHDFVMLNALSETNAAVAATAQAAGFLRIHLGTGISGETDSHSGAMSGDGEEAGADDSTTMDQSAN